MLIECTFCHAKAKIPDSKEGAKVKCGSCGKVYVARDPNARASGKTNPTPFIIGGVALVAVIGLILFVNSKKDEPAPPPPVVPVKVDEPKIDRTGWNSEHVQLVKGLYEAAFASNTTKVANSIHLERRVEFLRTQPAGAELPPFAEMTPLQKDDVLQSTVETLIRGDIASNWAGWKAHDGKVLAEGDTEIGVRIEVHGREAPYDVENRNYDWKLARDKDGKWKAYSWERYISPEELSAKKSAVAKQITKVQLEGGGMLFQADPRALAHLDDTPPEMRTKIDGLVEKLLDLSLRAKEVTRIRNDLLDIGKPALPILLTKMYEIKIVDDDSLMRVTQVHAMLKDITGYDPGFSPLGSGPESEKLRDITIKAWFAWYLRAGERFKERKVGEDALDAIVNPTERDKREIEKAKKGGG